MDNLKKVFLNDHHINLGANLTPFGGFIMPLYYTTIALEHESVRNNVGVFDVSHMGEIIIIGEETLVFLNYLLSSKIIVSNKIQYAMLLNDSGNVIDDLMVYPFEYDNAMLVVNASNIEKDLNHINQAAKNYNVNIIDKSNEIGCLAVQGPKSYEILSKLYNDLPQHSSEFIFKAANSSLIISRSGYTGEDGFEVYGDETILIPLWEKLIELEVTPIGLGARDTLRFEAAMPLYGNELSEEINPIEAGLSFAVDFTKDDFIGKTALLKYKEQPKRKLVALELLEKNIARAGYEVYYNDIKIGYITTGYLTPSTKKALAFALIDINYAKLGTILTIKIRNKNINAIVRNKKFIEKKNKK